MRDRLARHGSQVQPRARPITTATYSMIGKTVPPNDESAQSEALALIKDVHASGGHVIPLPYYMGHLLPEDATDDDATERRAVLTAIAHSAGLLLPGRVGEGAPRLAAMIGRWQGEQFAPQKRPNWRHNPYAVYDLIKAIHRSDGRSLSRREIADFSDKTLNLGRPTIKPHQQKKRGRPTKRAPLEELYHQAYLRRRRWFHLLVRLDENRPVAAATRKRAGKPSREIVFALATEALSGGCHRRMLRREIKAMAAARAIVIPKDWQLGRLIREFLKVDTTALP